MRLKLNKQIVCPECHTIMLVARCKVYGMGKKSFILHPIFDLPQNMRAEWSITLTPTACSRAGDSIRAKHNYIVNTYSKGIALLQFRPLMCEQCHKNYGYVDILPCKLRVKFTHATLPRNFCRNSATSTLASHTLFI